MFDNSEDAIRHAGNTDMLNQNKIAVLCSNKCPGSLIIKAQDLAYKLGKGNTCIISGFHTPVEREMLRVLLKGTAPIIICLARGLYKRVPKTHKKAFEQGRLLYVSAFPQKVKRTNAVLSAKRNSLVLELTDELCVIYAEKGGQTDKMVKRAVDLGKKVITIN